MFDVRSLLEVDCGACGVKVKASNIRHNSVGSSVFSGQPFSAQKIMGYYYETTLYKHLIMQKLFQKTYDDGIMSATVVDFSKWAFRALKTFFDRSRKQGCAWIIPTSFVAYNLLTIVATSLETSIRRFNVVCNHNRTAYFLCKFLSLTARPN